MRFVSRTLAFLIVILLAFWFTAENANELVTVDLVFVRIRASLPLVVFTSVLVGMGLSAWYGWRAERRTRQRLASHEAAVLGLGDPSDDLGQDYAQRDYMAPEREPVERSPHL